MRTDDGIENVVYLHEARGTGADLTGQLALFPAGDRRPPATLASAPAEVAVAERGDLVLGPARAAGDRGC